MTLRTPRRRISPRTKLRYRAIREFFRRALGSTSQQDIKINSSIAVNVTDLKRKIVGLEQQLDEVNKHCRDFACLDNCSRRESQTYFQPELKHETIKEETETSADKITNGIETQLIYKSSEANFKKFEDPHQIPKTHNDNDILDNRIMNHEYGEYITKEKKVKRKPYKISDTSPKLHKHKARSVYDNVATAYSTSSFHSLANNTRLNHPKASYPGYSNDRTQLKKEYVEEVNPQHRKDKMKKENMKKNMGDHFKVTYEDKPTRIHKNKRHTRELDQDFIADIIRRQYKPVKMFGRKQSDLSQFSAPVCRDHEYSVEENILEGSELCSCFYEDSHKRSKSRRQDLSGMRSVCDARLYSSKKLRQRYRRMHADAYSNSDMYDLIPVKERSSPKTRRKFAEENRIPYDYYREVPPSPRTLRPRLNLKAQYNTQLENYMARAKHSLRKRSPNRQERYQECIKHFENDTISEDIPVISNRNAAQLRKPRTRMNIPVEANQHRQEIIQNTGTTSSLQYPQYVNEQTSVAADTSLNKTQETVSTVDKTDKALCEIKDILQSFLHEIKKETVASQCGKSDITCKTREINSNVLPDTNTKANSNVIPNSTSFNNCPGQCGISPYLAPFTNPCCYPVMPVCPMNCPMSMPNGYIMPSQSFTCANCVNVPKETSSARCCNKTTDATCHHSETDELIKEIYKFVAQAPPRKVVNDDVKRGKTDVKILTSRSAGGSYKNFCHDAKVGTPALKCYSKSCEAIGSRILPEEHYSGTNASYSDTVLEKLSLEATTQSISETELDTETTDPDKTKKNKFSKVLRSFGLFKKKKKDIIEELSESESVIDVELKPKRPPFKQEVTNYVMHEQEYYRHPPVDQLYQRPHGYQVSPREYQSRQHEHQPRPHEYPHRPPGCLSRPHECCPRPHEFCPRPHDYPQYVHPPRSHEYQQRPSEYQPEYHPPYNPDVRGYPSPELHDPYALRHPRVREHSPCNPLRQRPTAPPFNNSFETSYSQVQPPVCLKEIEVKSTGTQSERKMSIFRKIKKKMQQPVMITPLAGGDEYQRTFSTQTPQIVIKPGQNFSKPAPNFTKPLFTWKSLQSKAMQGMPKDTDPMAYSLKTQKELAAGDLKLRNAMLRKLFYKRNPFSPRNLIVRTLLGKDKSSYGEPQTVFRPRMFL